MLQIQRYVLSEVAKVFLLVFLGTTLIMSVCVGVSQGIKLGLPLLVACRLLPSVISESLRMTVPFSILFGVCSVFGRISSDGEMTAIKTLGIHPGTIFLPPIWFAIVLSFGTFGMYEVCARWARPAVQRILVETCDEVAYGALQAEGKLQVGDLSMVVKAIRDRELVAPRISYRDRQGNLTIAKAAAATLQRIGQSGRLHLSCQNLKFVRNGINGFFPEFHYEIPFREPNQKSAHRYSPAELPANLLDSQIRYEQKQLAMLATTGQLKYSAEELRRSQDGHKLRLHRLQAEFSRRMSNGFAALAFTMIGIPVAVRRESRDNITTFFFCIVPISLIYYPLLVFGETIAKKGVTPALSVWIAPATLMIIGAVMLTKWTKN